MNVPPGPLTIWYPENLAAYTQHITVTQSALAITVKQQTGSELTEVAAFRCFEEEVEEIRAEMTESGAQVRKQTTLYITGSIFSVSY